MTVQNSIPVIYRENSNPRLKHKFYYFYQRKQSHVKELNNNLYSYNELIKTKSYYVNSLCSSKKSNNINFYLSILHFCLIFSFKYH